MQPQYYQTLANKEIQCSLCPHMCHLKPGKTGLCGVRTNDNGIMHLPYYGKISSIAVDPIEKKPLYHFFPGSQILSIGFWGCNFRCPFCQNYRISQQTSSGSHNLTPEQLVDLAVKERSFALAYTYSEPLIHFEFIKATALLAKEKGIKNVLVSNGFLNPGPTEELLEFIDAANIDLKGFNQDFYKKEICGSLDEVKRFLTQAASRIVLEVTTLVIPGKNDSEEEIVSIAAFIAALNRSIPLHLSCYYPNYKYNIPPTNPADVLKLTRIAREHLDYVYPGNIGYQETNTECPRCGNLLIKRTGYHTTIKGMENGKCSKCGNSIYS